MRSRGVHFARRKPLPPAVPVSPSGVARRQGLRGRSSGRDKRRRLAWLALCLWGPVPVRAEPLPPVAAEIREEALRPGNDPGGRPLPLAASWNTGVRGSGGYGPDWQLRMIEQGHHLLPWFQLDPPSGHQDVAVPGLYYPKALRRCRELGLPVSFIGTQWERLLSDEPEYLGRPAAANPNVVRADGGIVPVVSPFGPVEPWRAVGRAWTGSRVARRLQSWYPDPPRVLFVSNNEHRKLAWTEAGQDRRFAAAGKDGEAIRKAVGDGWITRYRALLQGMREGLEAPSWRRNARFIGYDAFGSGAFGRWPGWIDYSLYTRGRIEPWPLAWDGASPSYYLMDTTSITDDTVWSPQIEAMNWVFMLDEAYRLNPDFWFELSVWDGYQPGRPTDKRAWYAKQGQTYTPERYAGMVKFGMWLLRPRVVREFRNPEQTVREMGEYFMAIVNAVDEIHADPVLESFWREGRLVANRSRKHPYRENIPEEYIERDRWFLLNTGIDPKPPWDLKTEIPVFSLALVKGKAPEREWLVYVQSPRGGLSGVRLSIPDCCEITAPSSQAGRYYRVKESDKTPEPIGWAK